MHLRACRGCLLGVSFHAMEHGKKHIAIIGGGPAGLMAAEHLAQSLGDVARIDVYERKTTPARKFLMAGRGGLNITHSEAMDGFMNRYGSARDWLAPLIARFTPDDLRAWCKALGQETFVGSSGRVFPQAMKASPLLRAWRQRLDALGVQLHADHDWRGFAPDGALIVHDVKGAQDKIIHVDAVLLALGGGSWPKLGSDGGWVDVLSAQGVGIAPLLPANAGFALEWSPYLRERFAGQPLKPVALSHLGQRVQGEAMITQSGIEGGAVYALSAALRDSIVRDGSADLSVDLRPNMTVEDLAQKLQAPRKGLSLGNFLRRTINLSPLAVALLNETTRDLAQLSAHDLAKRIKDVPLRLTGMMDIDRAISSAGGILRDGIDANMMLVKIPGVFVAGEMIDWEAPTGGYLLQATFATGVAAAQGIATYLKK